MWWIELSVREFHEDPAALVSSSATIKGRAGDAARGNSEVPELTKDVTVGMTSHFEMIPFRSTCFFNEFVGLHAVSISLLLSALLCLCTSLSQHNTTSASLHFDIITVDYN
jgi:hypothetical protein